MSARLRLAVLISGRGSNLQALIEACAAPDYPAEIALVLSNRPEAGGLAKASAAGLTTETVDHRGFDGRDAFDAAIDARLRAHRVELVCLAGFMRILTPGFTAAWLGRMINIHPSLLPAFKGLDTHRRAIEAGARLAGCTVHYVTPDVDDGPILGQAALAIGPNPDPAALAARVLTLEHQLYPRIVRLIAEGRARLEDGRAVIDADAMAGDGSLISP